MKTYRVNEIFYSLQGEGARAGMPYVFVRFSGCNLTCRKETEGFDCDTEFVSGTPMTAEQIVAECARLWPTDARSFGWVLLTGGEPLLQVDGELAEALYDARFFTALETNGTLAPKDDVTFDYIACSPKTAEHTLRIGDSARVDELRYVRHAGQAIPRPSLKAEFLFVSPAWEGEILPQANLEWCIRLVNENPGWRLSVQQHKLWRVR